MAGTLLSRIDGHESRLSPTERHLLACLALHEGRPVSPADLAREAYGGAVSAGAVKVALWRLRQKLNHGGLRLVVLPQVGYRLVIDENPPAADRRTA